MGWSIHIETPRLRLRPFREDDLDALARLNAEPAIWPWFGEKPMSRADTWRQIAIFMGHQQMRGYSMLAIEDRATGELLGRSGPWFPEGWPMVEVGWMVDPTRQGQGIATEAGQASLDWCFGTLGATEVCSLIRPHNLASARVAAKLGGIIERQLDNFYGATADVWVHRPPA